MFSFHFSVVSETAMQDLPFAIEKVGLPFYSKNLWCTWPPSASATLYMFTLHSELLQVLTLAPITVTVRTIPNKTCKNATLHSLFISHITRGKTVLYLTPRDCAARVRYTAL